MTTGPPYAPHNQKTCRTKSKRHINHTIRKRSKDTKRLARQNTEDTENVPMTHEQAAQPTHNQQEPPQPDTEQQRSRNKNTDRNNTPPATPPQTPCRPRATRALPRRLLKALKALAIIGLASTAPPATAMNKNTGAVKQGGANPIPQQANNPAQHHQSHTQPQIPPPPLHR